MKNSSEINQLIDFINEFFRRNPRRDWVTLKELDKDLDIALVGGEEKIKKFFKNNPKIHYDEVKKIFTKIKKYEINSESDFLNVLNMKKEGIPENQDLYDCFPKKEIEKIKKEQKVRIVEGKDKKVVFFSLDKEFDKEKYELPEILKEKFLERIKLGNSYAKEARNKMEINFAKEKKKRERKARKKKERKQMHIYNDWMIGKIDFNENFRENN